MYWTEDKKKAAKALIIDEMSDGHSLASIVDDNDRTRVPAYSTIMEWLAADKTFAESYGRAGEVRAQRILEDILTIADDDSQDVVISEKSGKIGMNKEFAARSRIRIDARFKYLEKTMPKKYGVKIDHTTDGKEIKNTITVGYGKKDLESYEDLL